MMVRTPWSRRLLAHVTAHQSNSTLLPIRYTPLPSTIVPCSSNSTSCSEALYVVEVQCRTLKINKFASAGIRFFSGEMGFGFVLREAKYVQKCTFRDFPTRFEFGQILGPNFLIQCTPFGVNLYLEQPQWRPLPAGQPVGVIFAYILPIPLPSLSGPVDRHP